MPKPSDLLQGTLDLLILKTLAREPMHGWAIAKRIQLLSDEVLSVQQGSLYPALHRLENQGWIAAEWKSSEHGRDAKVYELTREGKRQLDARARVVEPAVVGGRTAAAEGVNVAQAPAHRPAAPARAVSTGRRGRGARPRAVVPCRAADAGVRRARHVRARRAASPPGAPSATSRCSRNKAATRARSAGCTISGRT